MRRRPCHLLLPPRHSPSLVVFFVTISIAVVRNVGWNEIPAPPFVLVYTERLDLRSNANDGVVSVSEFGRSYGFVRVSSSWWVVSSRPRTTWSRDDGWSSSSSVAHVSGVVVRVVLGVATIHTLQDDSTNTACWRRRRHRHRSDSHCHYHFHYYYLVCYRCGCCWFYSKRCDNLYDSL